MNSGSDRMRMNVEGDRISSLPDDLIAKILSFIGTKQAVETSVLSSRWRSVWTKIPYLNISNEGFPTIRKFHKFFTNVLSACNNQVEMSLNLHGKISQVFVQKILKHACSHNIQQLSLTFLCDESNEVPLSLFTSQSLKHLTMIGPGGGYRIQKITPTSMWELPALTTLHLDNIVFFTDDSVDLFSKCTNLKDLTMNHCRVSGLNNFTIHHPQLSHFSLINGDRYTLYVVTVFAPQLKNLTIINYNGKHMISAPELTSLIYKNRAFDLSIDSEILPFLEEVDLSVQYTGKTEAYKVVDLLQKFNNVKFLTLSLEILELLSSSLEAIALLPSPFFNLRSLKIHPELFDDPPNGKVTVANEVKKYLLDSSPGATFTTVTREESRAVRDAASAQKYMAELRVLLDQEKSRFVNHEEEDKRPEPCTKMPVMMSKEVAQIHSYWEDLNEQIKQGKEKIIPIITLMQRIKELLINLPTSKKAELQPCFSSLCAEADTVMKTIVDRMKVECFKKESELSVSLHELATAAQLSS